MTDEAPNFSGTYPNAGKLIGPMWQWMWAKMAEARGEWLPARFLAGDCAELHGSAPGTARGLLSQAARAGLIERRYEVAEGIAGARVVAEYRRPVASS